jgi:hypothetical protein
MRLTCSSISCNASSISSRQTIRFSVVSDARIAAAFPLGFDTFQTGHRFFSRWQGRAPRLGFLRYRGRLTVSIVQRTKHTRERKVI